MKLFLLVLAASVGYSECQQCQCGLFAGAPADTQGIPLEYVNRASGVQCDGAAAAGCQAECQAVGADRDQRAYCETHREYGNHRCIGGYWCERLYNLNVSNHDTVNSAVDVYYRLNGCADDMWVDAGYQFEERLCCSDGYFDQCEGECADCARENLCEGGVFIQEQFDVVEQGINPILLETLAMTTAQNCTAGPGWPDLENQLHDCDRRLLREGSRFFATLDLNGIVEGTSYTWGQQYCSALYYRWGDRARGVYAKLLLYRGRMPDCKEDEDRFLWNQDVVYAQFDYQLLCCDDDANYCDCNECKPAGKTTMV